MCKTTIKERNLKHKNFRTAFYDVFRLILLINTIQLDFSYSVLRTWAR